MRGVDATAYGSTAGAPGGTESTETSIGPRQPAAPGADLRPGDHPDPYGVPPAPQGGQPIQHAVESDRFTRFLARLYTRLPRWTAPVAALGCVGAAVGYTVLTEPTSSAADAPPTCLLKLTTGLDCPGCGGTRAFWYLLHGDLPAAARHHLLFVFAVPFLSYLFVAWAVRQTFGWRLPQLRVPPATLGVFLAAWFAFSVLRNLPWAPFTMFYV